MNNPESLIRPPATENDNSAREEARHLRESSLLLPKEGFSVPSPPIAFKNEMSDGLGRIGREDLSTHAPSNIDDIEMTEVLRRSSQGLFLAASEAPAFTREDPSETSTRNSYERPIKSHQPQSSVPTRSGVGWKRSVQDLNRNWTAETLSYIVSILAFAGLVTTLLAHQTKPLPQWPQLVTINSIISLFSLLMRAGVGVVLAEGLSQCKWNWYRKARKLEQIERLDFASRGSWGSVTLLYHFRPRNAYYVAMMGALITIMASFTGFFSQQLVQFRDCPQKDTTAVVNISRTNSYARIGGWGQSNVPMEYTPMVTAINVGLLERLRDLTSVLSSGCNSGNCTFSEPGTPSFSSLGILHYCQDTTRQIRVVNESDSEVYLRYEYGDNQSIEWNRVGYGVVASSWIEPPSSFPGIIMSFYIRFRPDYTSTDWNIVNCSLIPMVNTYNAKIENAVLEEILTDFSYLEPVTSNVPDIPDTLYDRDIRNLVFSWSHRTTKNHTIRNGTRALCEGSESSAHGLVEVPEISDEPTYVNLTGQRNPSAGWKWMYYPEDCVWGISRFSMTSIRDTLTDVFSNQNITSGRKGGVSGSTHLQVLFKDGNMTFDSVNQRIEGLAKSMTSVFRTDGGYTNTSDPYLQYSSGTLWVNTTCMYIRWPWITFPAAMIALTGIFLVLVAVENHGIETDRLWKSSFLAALFCEVEVDKTPDGKLEMKSIARSTSVSLQRESSTLRLVHR